MTLLFSSFAKASSYDGVEMLSAGEEQGDIELKETFSGESQQTPVFTLLSPSLLLFSKIYATLTRIQCLFAEVVKRLAGGRLDLHKAESCKEQNEDLLASRTSSTFSASSEYEANISMLPNEAPEAPTSSETSTPSDVNKTQSLTFLQTLYRRRRRKIL